jgi:hypothetical protein
MRRLVLPFLAIGLVASPGLDAADPAGARYFPLRDGQEWVHEKETVAAATFPTGPVRHAYKWTITSWVDGRERREGREYAVYPGSSQDGRWREERVLAFPPDVGRVWPYDDGRPSRLRRRSSSSASGARARRT